MIPELSLRTLKDEQGKKYQVYRTGYFLTLKDLAWLCREFQADCRDGFVSNDEGYIEEKLKDYEAS
ncbi:MAG: hypothetical protein WDA29_10470 [Flavobacteriaceae bacterium]|jgi:hypothetical protein|nr:hypothetical protein [Candidatus Kapabacteria bacterium]